MVFTWSFFFLKNDLAVHTLKNNALVIDLLIIGALLYTLISIRSALVR